MVIFSSVLEEKILKLNPQCNNYNLMNYHKTSLCSTLSKDLDLRLTLYTSLFVSVHAFSSFLVCGIKTFCKKWTCTVFHTLYIICFCNSRCQRKQNDIIIIVVGNGLKNATEKEK